VTTVTVNLYRGLFQVDSAVGIRDVMNRVGKSYASQDDF